MMMAAAACMFAAACDKTENNDEPNLGYYLTAIPLEGSEFGAFTDGEMRFVLEEGVLKMNKVKFAERMPRLDIEVPGVTPDGNGEFRAESIVPTFNGQPMAQYVMTDFVLKMHNENRTMTVEFDCMTMHVTYTGLLPYEFAE